MVKNNTTQSDICRARAETELSAETQSSAEGQLQSGVRPHAEALLTWYDANRRSLPWREDPAPYHVWLSEIMLQQTRVDAVREYYTCTDARAGYGSLRRKIR